MEKHDFIMMLGKIIPKENLYQMVKESIDEHQRYPSELNKIKLVNHLIMLATCIHPEADVFKLIKQVKEENEWLKVKPSKS